MTKKPKAVSGTITLTGTVVDGSGASSTFSTTAPLVPAEPEVPPPENLPVCTPASFAVPSGAASDTLVGVISATNSPTSFSIVSGNDGNHFQVWPSANLRTSEPDFGPPPPDGTYNLSVAAANASGTGPTAAVDVTVGVPNGISPPTSPGYDNDGATGAPQGTTIQHPTWLQGANTGTSTQSPAYAKRPPWKVAGVDYPVGIPAAVLLKDPTITLPAGCSLSGRALSVTADNVTIDGYDFSKNSGITVNTNGRSGTVIQNCKFYWSVDTAAPGLNLTAAAGSRTTVQYCDIDGANINMSGWNCIVAATGSGDLLFQYNWVRNSQSDIIGMQAGNQIYQYNVLENSGTAGLSQAGQHPDFFQWGGASTTNPVNATIAFNTLLQNCSAKGSPNQGFSQGMYLANTVFKTVLINNNTMRSSPGATPTGIGPNGGLQMHGWVSGIPAAGSSLAPGGSVDIKENYCDPTDCSGFAYSRGNVSFSGNVNMLTGASFDSGGKMK